MQLAMIGLGRMGASMVPRLIHKGHDRVVHDRQPAAIEAMPEDGAVGAASRADLAAKTSRPRAIRLRVPPPVLSAALYARFSSRGEEGIANQLLSAMRHEFGGQVETKVERKT